MAEWPVGLVNGGESIGVFLNDADSNPFVAKCNLLNVGFFRQIGKAWNPVNLRLHFVQDFLNAWNVAANFDNNVCRNFSGDGRHFLDTVNRPNGLFDLLENSTLTRT